MRQVCSVRAAMDNYVGTLANIHEAAEAVYKELGGGLSESIYQHAMAIELRNQGHVVETEVVIPVNYHKSYVGFIRADIIVNSSVILELKVVSKISDTHRGQLKSYLIWASRAHNMLQPSEMLGMLVNFGASALEIEVDKC